MIYNRVLKFIFSAVAVCTVLSFADAVSTEALASGGAQMRENQLEEIRDVLRGGRGGYLGIGFNYIPLASQTPLKSEFGEHEGFAFRHHLAGFGSGEIDKNNHLGFLLWFDRSGWDGEDFLLIPQYNEFSAIRSVTTWGFSYTQSALDLTTALGMQHQNVEKTSVFYPDENDSLLYTWAHFRWKSFSAQGNFHRLSWRNFRFSLDLEAREVYGGEKYGLKTYLPNVEAILYNGGDGYRDSVRVRLEQNLYGQNLYGELAFDFPRGEFKSAALKYYPDPSRMVGFEATCLRRNVRKGAADLLWGGAIDVLFLRIAYNSSYEYERLYHAKGTIIAEVKFDMATIDGFLFSRGASRSAPMETLNIERKNKDVDVREKSVMEKNKNGSDVIEAKGIRYEKIKSKKE